MERFTKKWELGAIKKATGKACIEWILGIQNQMKIWKAVSKK